MNTTASHNAHHDHPRGQARYLAAFVAMMVSVGALALIGATAASAAMVRTWTGAGTNALWTNPANWGGAAPQPGDDLVFPAGAARTTNSNNFVAGTAFHSLRFTGEFNTYTITGNQVALGTGGISTDAMGTVGPKVRVMLPIRLTANESFTFGSYAFASPPSFTYSGAIDLAGHNLVLSGAPSAAGTHRLTGALSGTGGLTADTHDGQYAPVVLAGTNTSTGTNTVNGVLYVDGDYSSRPVLINIYGALGGSGKVGRVLAFATGATVWPASSTAPTAILTVAGDLAMRASTTYYEFIKAATPGTGYSQTVVTGNVSINPATALTVAGLYHPVAGQAFTIIANQGPAAVSGNFANQPEGSLVTAPDSKATFRITYKGGASGRDVVLTAVGTGVTRTWTGAGPANVWTNPANWAGGVAPKAGDDLVFPAGGAQTTNVDNFAAGTSFHSITLGGDGSGGYTLSGNAVVVGAGGITSTGAASYTSTLSLPLKIDADETFNVDTGHQMGLEGDIDLSGHVLRLSGSGTFVAPGVLSGGGTLLHDGSGDLGLDGSSAGPGAIKVAGGHVYIGQGYDYASRSVIVDGPAGTTFASSGPIGSVSVINGQVSQHHSIPVNGSLTLAAGATYQETMSSGIPFGDCCQVAVKAKVSLGGAVLRPVAISEIPVGTVVSVVANQGGTAVSGTFAGLAEGATVADADNPSWIYRISYVGGASGNDVTLTRLA